MFTLHSQQVVQLHVRWQNEFHHIGGRRVDVGHVLRPAPTAYRYISFTGRRFVDDVTILTAEQVAGVNTCHRLSLSNPRCVTSSRVRHETCRRSGDGRSEVDQADVDFLSGGCLQQPRLSPGTALDSGVGLERG